MAAALMLLALGASGASSAQAFGHVSPTPATFGRVGAAPALRPQVASQRSSHPEDPSSLLHGVGAFACGAAVALVAHSAARGRVAMRFKPRYGGGATKYDPAAEFGPQYNGPRLDYTIQRGPQLGRPMGGDQRVIPKLSGGSWEKRKNMMRNMTTNLIRHGRIKTTYSRAMAVRSFVDRMIILAKRGDDLSRREAEEWMVDGTLTENLFKLAPERYADRKKNFTQVTRTMNRKGDWAEMAYIELV